MENPCRYYKVTDHAKLEFHTNARPVCMRIKVAKTPEEVDIWLKQQRPSVLGFDIEWKPFFSKTGKQNKASLLQLSSNDDVLLIQLFQVSVSNGLREVLGDECIKKVGVGIVADAVKMLGDWGVIVNGLVNLGQGKSLAKVAFAATEIRLSKHKKICLSNWENKTLTNAQIIYAALDAWVASESFAVLSRVTETQ
jgi:hypothetical protein